MNQNFILTPGYITGLVQTDGSFSCIISTSPEGKVVFIPNLTITTDLDSKFVLDAIQSFWDCGKINVDVKDNTANLVVSSRKEFIEKIFPHFDKYPLFCAKLHSYNLLKIIIEYLINNKHKTEEGKKEIAIMALSMNTATQTRKLDRINTIRSTLDISDNIPLIPNTINSITTPITNDNISGIIDGDGSFWVSFQKNGLIQTGFSITADNASLPLLKDIQNQFKNIGSIQYKTTTFSVYFIRSLKDIINILIPFVDANPLFSERANHYKIFKEVSIILSKEKPLTLETKLKIVELAYNANKNGKRRRLTKSDYIKLLYDNNTGTAL